MRCRPAYFSQIYGTNKVPVTEKQEALAMAPDIYYDLLVYHDMTDTIHDTLPPVGTDAGTWFGESYKDLNVVAVGPGIHGNRVTVVLAHNENAMPEIQALLDRTPK